MADFLNLGLHPSPLTGEHLTAIIRRASLFWLEVVDTKVRETAEGVASKFGKKAKTFGTRHYSIGRGAKGTVYCIGPYVQVSAWDYTFTVPPGGFKYNDYDPVTGLPFPGGLTERGSYVTLEDKPTAEGEDPKAVARTYSQHSGETIKHIGFFSEAIRVQFGTGTMLSTKGRVNLQVLANTIAREYASSAAAKIVQKARSMGYEAKAGKPLLITITKG